MSNHASSTNLDKPFKLAQTGILYKKTTLVYGYIINVSENQAASCFEIFRTMRCPVLMPQRRSIEGFQFWWLQQHNQWNHE
jgi:hypothetical protein